MVIAPWKNPALAAALVAIPLVLVGCTSDSPVDLSAANALSEPEASPSPPSSSQETETDNDAPSEAADIESDIAPTVEEELEDPCGEISDALDSAYDMTTLRTFLSSTLEYTTAALEVADGSNFEEAGMLMTGLQVIGEELPEPADAVVPAAAVQQCDDQALLSIHEELGDSIVNVLSFTKSNVARGTTDWLGDCDLLCQSGPEAAGLIGVRGIYDLEDVEERLTPLVADLEAVYGPVE